MASRPPPPSAPTRSRRLPTRQAAPSSVNNSSTSPDELADDLTSLRITNAPTFKPLSSAAPTVPASRRLPPSSRPLALSKPPAAKAAPPAPASSLSPSERGKQAMRTVNTSLQTLAGVSKSGWRAIPISAAPSHSSRPTPLKLASSSSSLSSMASATQNKDRVDAAVGACGAALMTLRQLIREGKINNRATEVEKAAGSLIANLVEMELYELALMELASMRVSILSWYDSDASVRLPPPLKPSATTKGKLTPTSRRPSLLTYAYVLSLPLPPPSFFDPLTLSEALSSTAARPLAQDIVPLVLAVQQYALGCLFRADLSAEEVSRRPAIVWEQLGGHGNPSEWRRTLDEHMVDANGESAEVEGMRRRVDAMMTSMFGTLTKGCVAMDQLAPPEGLLFLRSRALLFFATTRPLYAEQAKLDAFYDQTRKVLLLFGRRSEEKKAGETKINQGVKRIFEEVVEVLVPKEAKMEGVAWVTLCEVVLHIAKRADDSAMVERVSVLIDSKALTSETVDPEAQVSQQCAKLVSALSVLETFCKTGEDKCVADQLRRVVTTIPILSKRRSQDLAPESHTKIDKVLERLRYVATRQLKGGRRLDQLITNVGDTKPALSEVDAGLLALLKALAAHVGVLNKCFSGSANSSPSRSLSNSKTLYEGAVESHLILSYSQLVVDDRITFTHAFANLEQSLPLIAAAATAGDSLHISDLDNGYSLRTLASAYYNIGGTLYNAGKSEAAIRFIKRSCQIGKAALEAASREEDAFLSTGEEDSSRIEALADLRKHMPKRWELLALAQQAIGEKHLAYEAYVSAITDFSDDSKVALDRVAATSSISTLVAREANLFKLVQRSTKLAIFDLLLPGPKTSLRERLSGAGYSTSASAAVVELQVYSLEPNLDKIEALNTIPALLDDLLELYAPLQFPMRRTRTLVRRLQHSCAPTLPHDSHSLVEDLAEIAGLCSPKTSASEDAALQSFAPQYLAFSHIWIGFHAHRAQLASASESTSQAAREGLRILRAAFDKDLPPSPSKPLVAAAKPAPKLSPKRVATATRRAATKVADKAAFKTPKTSRTLPGSWTCKTELVTPPSKGAIDLTHRSTPPRGEVVALLFDDPDLSYSALETMATLLGALGYSLLRISYLRFLRRIVATLRPQAQDTAYVTTSAYLGHEYVRLGKTSRAGVVIAQAELRIQACAKSGGALVTAAHVTYLTHYAEYLAVVGNRERSSKAYCDAHQLALTLVPDDSSLSVPNRIVERTRLLQRSASAAGVCSVMLQRRGDLTRALSSAMQALRVWTRALNNVSRLSAQEPPASDPSSAFTSLATDKNAPLADFPNGSRKRQRGPSSGPNAGLVWQVSESLASALLRVATLHSIRGNPKSAEHYTQQAIDFAQDLGSTRLFARALVVRAEIRLHAGNFADASSDLDLVDHVLGEKQTSCPEAIDAQRIRADLLMRDPAVAGAAKDAQAYCLEAQKLLETFVEAAEAGEAGQSPSKLASPGRTTLVKFSSPIRSTPVRPSPARPSPSPGRHHPSSDSILPTLHAYLLRMRVGLLQKENRRNKDDECQMLLRRLSKYGTSDEDRADELKLLASIQFQKLLSRLNSDAVLQALPEAVLSMPTFGVLAAKAGSPSSGSSLLHCLRDVEVLLADAVALSLSRAEPTKLRELSLFTANLRAVQASVGPTSKQSIPARVASVLDLGLAVTLRREMLDAIDRKLAGNVAPDDIEWPMPDHSTSTSSDHPDGAMRPMLDFWTSARERYRTESAEPTMTDPSLSTLLPPNWTVVSLHLATERDCLLIVRHRHGSTPLIFKLPLDRFARREDDEEESFTYDAALAELRDVIVASNAGAQNAKDVTGKDARASWWKERKDLDVRLQNLTLMMEDSWLGAFKTVFLDARQFTTESIATFKSQIERVMKRTVIRSAKKTTRFKLDDSILACLSALPPDARDEDIEDAFYFMLESLQFSGMPVAIDEIEVDQVVCDLRIPLEELHAANANSPPVADEHTFLILDKAIQSFPWESIPCLRGRSISRLPSVAFLRDRITLAGVLADASPDAASPPTSRHEILVDSSRTSFVLNPSGDLKTTQNNFEPWLEKMKGAGWSGVVGRAPSEEEVKVALSTRDLFLYFGHGGAEQFIRSQTVRNLERCAVTMLWGCSSGLLKDLGDFDPVGTPYHYMVAGCPALVANLWDVTDKDIDKFSDAVFRKLGLNGEARDEDDPGPTLAAAIGGSRDVCLLRYLNGAAPVVYGVPVRFSRIAA